MTLMQNPKRIILDTDIGTDPDDAIALSLAMISPEIHLDGITTVYGDVDTRNRLARKLLQLGGRDEVPIYNGIKETLLLNRDVWWAGHEGEGVLKGDEPVKSEGHAVDFIVKTIKNNPGEITLVAIGPLTNIAVAILREPEIARNVKELIIMGGVTRLGDNALELPAIEHNIKCDPEAASVVFSSGAPITMVGLDVTMKVQVGNKEIEELIATGKPLNLALAEVIKRWLKFIGMNNTAMHDPLAVALIFDKTLVNTRRMKVKVEFDHRDPSGMTIALPADDGNVDVCLDVDSKRFIDMLLSRLSKFGDE
jgi:purine nucleosidase